MAEQLDAIAREFFSLNIFPQRTGQDCGAGGHNSAAPVAAASPREGEKAANTCGEKFRCNKPHLLSLANEKSCFFPPLMQYFSALAIAGGTPSHTSSTGVAGGDRDELPNNCVDPCDAVLTARRPTSRGPRTPKCCADGAFKGHHCDSAHEGRNCFSLLCFGAEEKRRSVEWIDVYTNYTQPPLTYISISYEALDRSYQKGLDAVGELVEHSNRSFVRGRDTTANFLALGGGRSTSSANRTAAGAADSRDTVVNCLKKLLCCLIERGNRILALHIIIKVVSWRFASRNERVTILYNHLITCLPSGKMSTVTLAMEAWGQLHTIEANSFVYLEVTNELLSFACECLQHDRTIDERLTGLVILRHVALWPTSLYRALLCKEGDILFLATWKTLFSDEIPAHIREVAAETLRALFIVSLDGKDYRPVHCVVQHAIKLMLFSNTRTDAFSAVSLSFLQQQQQQQQQPQQLRLEQQYQPSGNFRHGGFVKKVDDVYNDHSTIESVTTQPSFLRSDSDGQGGEKIKKSFDRRTFRSSMMNIVLKVRNFFKGNKRHQAECSNTSTISDYTMSVQGVTAAGGAVNFNTFNGFSADMYSPFYKENKNISGSFRQGRHKLQWSLSQLPPPANSETVLHAGTLVVGAFIGSVRICAKNSGFFTSGHMEENLGSMLSSTHQHMMAGVTNTSTSLTPEQTSVTNSFQRRSLSLSSLNSGCERSGKVETLSCTHVDNLPIVIEKDEVSAVPNATATENESFLDLPSIHEEKVKEDDDNDNGDDCFEGSSIKDDAEWSSFCVSTGLDTKTFAAISSLQQEQRRREQQRRRSLCFLAKRAYPLSYGASVGHRSVKREGNESQLITPKTYLMNKGKMQNTRQNYQRFCYFNYNKLGFESIGKRRNRIRAAPSHFGGLHNSNTVKLENILPTRTVRKLLTLCFASDTLETVPPPSSRVYTERLLPVLALYSPCSLRLGELEKALRILFARAALVFCNSTDVQQSHGVLGKSQCCSDQAMSCTTNASCCLALINIGLFLSAISHYYPSVFDAAFLEFYSLLFCALQHWTPKYCSAAFPVLALLVHNIPVGLRERFWPFIEQLTDIAISAPFVGEMAGIAMKICAIYKDLRPRCQTALLRSIAKVLGEGGVIQISSEANITNDEKTKSSASLPETNSQSLLLQDFPSAAYLSTSMLNIEEKLICFRLLQGFCKDWECSAKFFINVCTPYMHHRDFVLRRECVFLCVSFLLSDCVCWVPFESSVQMPASTCGRTSTFASKPGYIASEREIMVEHVKEHNLLVKVNLCGFSERPNHFYFKGERKGVFFLRLGDPTSTTVNTNSAIPVAMGHSNCKGTDSDNANIDLPSRKGVLTSDSDVTVTRCIKHTGRWHINTLREMLHRLVEVAVCDPERSVRYVALNSFSPATDQFLYTYAEIVDLFFTSLNDEYLSNRIVVVKILRRIAQYTPSTVYPRLRKFFLHMIKDLNDRSLSSISSFDGVTITSATPETTNNPNITVEHMQLLFELLRTVPHPIVLYMDGILRLLQSVLMSHFVAERGTVAIALNMLSYLMDESTRNEWHRFEVFMEVLSVQLLFRDGDAERLRAAICALEKLIQGIVVTESFCNKGDLNSIVGGLHLLLLQKPSIGSELSLLVLKLLGTISSVEPCHQLTITNGISLLLGRPCFERFLQFPLHIGNSKIWSRQEQHHQFRTHLIEHIWPDLVLRLLLRTFIEAKRCVIAFTDEELRACLQAAVAILREADILRKLDHYMPFLLIVLWDLLDCTGENASLRISTMENIAELVQLAGRAIAPTYSLLVAFIQRYCVSWCVLNSCCKLIIALCTAVPELVRENCEWFLSHLLDKLMRLVDGDREVFAALNARDIHSDDGPVASVNVWLALVTDVLKAIRFLLPVSDHLTIQSVCLELAKLLRNHANTSEPLQADGNNDIGHYSANSDNDDNSISVTTTSIISNTNTNTTISAVLKEKVFHDIVRVLFDFVNSCDVATVGMAIVESIVLQLWYYARVHDNALRLLASALQKKSQNKKEQSWREKKLFLFFHNNNAVVKLEKSRSELERELCKRRGDQKSLFDRSLLTYLLIVNTEEKSVLKTLTPTAMVANSNESILLSFDDDLTSWESLLEMDLFACLLLVVGRCRGFFDLHEVTLKKYLNTRFDPESSVIRLVSLLKSTKYCVFSLPVWRQPQPQQEQEHEEEDHDSQSEKRHFKRHWQQRNKEEEGKEEKNEYEQHQKKDEYSEKTCKSIVSVAENTTLEISPCPRLGSQQGTCFPFFSTNEGSLRSKPIPTRMSHHIIHGSYSSSVSTSVVMPSQSANIMASSLESATQKVFAIAGTSGKSQSDRQRHAASLSLVKGHNVRKIFALSSSVTAAAGIYASRKSSFELQKPLPHTGAFLDNKNTVVNNYVELTSTDNERNKSAVLEGNAKCRLRHTDDGTDGNDNNNNNDDSDNNNNNDDSDNNNNNHDDSDSDDVSTEYGDETDEQRFFLQHENILACEWSPWFEQFCTMLVERSDYVCVRSCSPLIYRHFNIFLSDLLPIAFLSHLTKCSNGVVRRWIKLLCDFVYLHATVPYKIAAEIVRLVHHIRLYGPYLFSKSLVKTIEEKYITLDFLSGLAERTLNPPLLLLYAEQIFFTGFSWEALARMAVALENILYTYESRVLSCSPFFRRAVHNLLQAKNNYTRRSEIRDNVTGQCEVDLMMLPWEKQQTSDDEDNSFEMRFGNDVIVKDKTDGCTLHPVLLELGWIDAASRVYMRSILGALYHLRDEKTDGLSESEGRLLLSQSDVIGAMRCYMRVYDFESILNLWAIIKDYKFAEESYSLTLKTFAENEQPHEQVERVFLNTVGLSSTEPKSVFITRYVVLAAQALSRWEILDEIHYDSFSFTKRCCSGDFLTCNYGDFSFFKQLEIFRASALTAKKEYDKAKEVLSALRTALKDSYGDYYTDNLRLKLELSILSEQISDLEEGIDAIEMKSALGDMANNVVSAAAANMAMGTSIIAGGNCGEQKSSIFAGATGSGNIFSNSFAGAHDHQQGKWRRRVAYTEATMRRLQNIADRPLFGQSVLQQFETISLRGTLVSPEWQLSNIMLLCERIASGGMPRRAVQTITHFYSLPLDNNDKEEEQKYREALLLERYRLELQHLCRIRDLERLQNELRDAVMLKYSTASQETSSTQSLTGVNANKFNVAVCLEQEVIDSYQAELLLLYLECGRRLKDAHKIRRSISLNRSSFMGLCPILDDSSLNAAGETFCYPFSTTSPRSSHARDAEDDESPESVLLNEYRLMERVIDSSTHLAPVWREFGLLLFDICMAIYSEWSSTKEPETLDNFCIQSKKAIYALQKAAQFWSSSAFAFTTGIGPFTIASTRESHHARVALPVAHLLLNSLHLALKLEDICADSGFINADSNRRTNINNNNNNNNTDNSNKNGDQSNIITNDTLFQKEVGNSGSKTAPLLRTSCRSDCAGFAALDFSPAMYLQWARILPFLMNAAARYRELHDAVRTMCVRSRAMLYQCVYLLVATFEHDSHSILELNEIEQQQSQFLMGENYECKRPSQFCYPQGVVEGSYEDGVQRVVQHPRPAVASVATTSQSIYGVPQRNQRQQHYNYQQVKKPKASACLSSQSGMSDAREEEKYMSNFFSVHHDSNYHSYNESEKHLQGEQKMQEGEKFEGRQQWRAAILRDLVEIDSEYKEIISQTIQLCEFVRCGKKEALKLGACALPVPMCLIQRHMAEMDVSETKQTSTHANKQNIFFGTTVNDTQSKRGIDSKNSSKVLRRILHVRRSLNRVFSDSRREDVFLFFLSDGSELRFHRIDSLENKYMSPLLPSFLESYKTRQRANNKIPTAVTAMSCFQNIQTASSTTVGVGEDTKVGGILPNSSSHIYGSGSSGRVLPQSEMQSGLSFIRPLALMESAVCCFLSYLPVKCTGKFFVLPVGLHEFITQLPDGEIHYSSWQVKLPPSLQFYSIAPAWRRPWSLFHILSEYSVLGSEGDALHNGNHHNDLKNYNDTKQEKEQQRQNDDGCNNLFLSQTETLGTSAVKETKGAHPAPSFFSTENVPGQYTNVVSISRSQRIRKKLVARYELLLENAFDKGDFRALYSFIRQVLYSKKLTDAEYPRPKSFLRELLSSIEDVSQCRVHTAAEEGEAVVAGEKCATVSSLLEGGNEETQPCEKQSSLFALPWGKWLEIDRNSETMRKRLQLALLKSEASWFSDVLRLAFRVQSANADQWLAATERYSRELAEWSMLQYLLDVTNRESTTFFIDLVDGHLASHHFGVHALQPLPRNTLSQSSYGLLKESNDATQSKLEKETKEDDENNIVLNSDMSFLSTDPTVFRLTASMVSQLPVKCPYGLFLIKAASNLYFMLRYRRDITGIVKFGFEDMKCFAWDWTTPAQHAHIYNTEVDFSGEKTNGTSFPDVLKRRFARGVESTASAQPQETQAVVCDRTTANGEETLDAAAEERQVVRTEGAVTTEVQLTEMSELMKTSHSYTDSVCVFTSSEEPSRPFLSKLTCKEECSQVFVSSFNDSTGNNEFFGKRTTTPISSALKGSALTESVEATTKSFFLTANTTAFGLHEAKATTLHSRVVPPRLFDGFSIIAKLQDCLLPMLDEPCLDAFSHKHLLDSGCLIRLFPSSESATIIPKAPITGLDSKFLSPLQEAATSTPTTSRQCNMVDNIVCRVRQLISAAVDQENLIGTLETPHSWCHWAPHW